MAYLTWHSLAGRRGDHRAGRARYGAARGASHHGVLEHAITGPPPLMALLTFISRQSYSHSYIHLILALGIVREPTL